MNFKKKNPKKKNVEINQDIVDRLVGHVRNKTTDMADADLHVPKSHFLCSEHLADELTVLKRMPLIVAHCSELKSPGDFITRTILNMPLIITRQSDGNVTSYLNICSHRGGRVETEESGNRRLFMCQYHGWSYDSDNGDLKKVPYEDFFEEIDHSCNGLKRVKTQERHGLIFVDFSNDADRDIKDYLGDEVDKQIEPWGLDKAVIFLDKTFPIKVNWKLVMDGAIDILHPQFLHPNGVGKLVTTNVSTWRDYGRHGQHFGIRKKFESVVANASNDEDLKGSSKYIASNLVIYPNSMMIAAPEHIEFWTLWPSVNDPRECTISIRFYVNPDILDEEMERRINKSWEILEDAAGNEDWPMEIWIQENLEADPEGSFLYGRNELPCQHLYRQLEKDIMVQKKVRS